MSKRPKTKKIKNRIFVENGKKNRIESYGVNKSIKNIKNKSFIVIKQLFYTRSTLSIDN